MSAANDKPDSGSEEELLEFHYIKSNFFRVIHCDGASGGFTSESDLYLSFWSERPAIPRKLVYSMTPEGQLDTEKEDRREEREGYVREVEVGMVMDVSTARAFNAFLTAALGALDEAKGKAT